MTPQPAILTAYHKGLYEQLIHVWERSVRSTHHFVPASGIDALKKLVYEIDFTGFPVYCLLIENTLIGFIGLSGSSIEMLFLDPDYIGQGYGKRLMQFALEKFHSTEVEVNEQNIHAVEFYKHFGFETYDRSDTDGNGKPYPILKMHRKAD